MVEKKAIEELRSLKANKECFDCKEKGTTYIVSNFGIFVCSKCSGLHRDLNHKVKGIGVSNFTPFEISFLQKWGNENAKNVWLGAFPRGNFPDSGFKDIQKMKEHLKAIFELKKYYKNPDESLKELNLNKEEDNSKKPSNVLPQAKNISDPQNPKNPQKPQKQIKASEEKEKKSVSPSSKINTPNLLEMDENAVPQDSKNDANLLSVNMSIGEKEAKTSNNDNWAKISVPIAPIKQVAPEKKEEKILSNLKELYNESLNLQTSKIQDPNIRKKDLFGEFQTNMMGNIGFNHQNLRQMNTSQIQSLVFQNVSNFCATYGISSQQYYMALQAMFTPKLTTLDMQNSQRMDKNEYQKQESKHNMDPSNPFDLLV